MTKRIALVGSGSAAIGYLNAVRKKILQSGGDSKGLKIVVFEKSQIAGTGLPYDRSITAPEHLFNVQTVSSVVPTATLDGEDRLDRGQFIEWLNKDSTKIYLRSEFEKIFFERFKRAYRRKFGEFDDRLFGDKNIFDPAFEESEFYRQNQGKEVFVAMFEHHRRKFSSYVEKVERDAKDAYGFLPRIVYGFYSKALFDYQIEELRKLGVDVEVRCETEVAAIQKISDAALAIVSKGKHQATEEFDHSFVASGLWHEEPSPYKNPNYVHNIWPANNVEELIERALKQAKEQGRDSIKIGILGTSLSAYDMFRTCFKDGMIVDGVRIEVDMCSRNGRLQKVKDNFNWLGESLTRHMPGAVEKVMHNRGLGDYTEDAQKNFFGNLGVNMSKIMEHEMAKNAPAENRIYLYQTVGVFLELLQAAYENNDEVKSVKSSVKSIALIRSQVLANGENYQETIALLRSLEKSDRFVQLRDDLAASKGDNIFLNIFNLFDESASFAKYLPDDEKIFYKKFAREFLGPTWAAMPPETAADLLEKHEAGSLSIRKLGRSAKTEIPDEGPMRITDSGDVAAEYDIVINTASAKLRANTASTLYGSIRDQFGNPLKSQTIEITEGREFIANARRKFGTEFAEEMIKSCQVKEQDGGELHIKFEDAFLSGLTPEVRNPLLVVSRATGSVIGATRVGEKFAGKIDF